MAELAEVGVSSEPAELGVASGCTALSDGAAELAGWALSLCCWDEALCGVGEPSAAALSAARSSEVTGSVEEAAVSSAAVKSDVVVGVCGASNAA